MLPQYSNLSILFVCVCVQKNLCVRSCDYIVAAFPPLCVSVHWVTLWVHLPLYVLRCKATFGWSLHAAYSALWHFLIRATYRLPSSQWEYEILSTTMVILEVQGYKNNVRVRIYCVHRVCTSHARDSDPPTRPHFMLLLSTKLFFKLTGTDRQTNRHRYR